MAVCEVPLVPQGLLYISGDSCINGAKNMKAGTEGILLHSRRFIALSHSRMSEAVSQFLGLCERLQVVWCGWSDVNAEAGTYNVFGYARIGCRSNPATTGGGAMAGSGASHVASTSSHGLGAVQTLRRVVVERWRVHLRPDWGPGNPC